MKSKKIVEAWNLVNPDEEAIARMRLGIVGVGQTGKTKRWRWRGGLVFALICLVLAGATAVLALTYTAQWHDGFEEYFHGPSQTEMEKYEGAVNVACAAATDNGVTIRVLQTVCDGRMLFLLLDISAPEGVELPDSVWFEHDEFSIDGGLPLGAGWSVFTDIVNRTPDANHISKMVRYELDGSKLLDGHMKLTLENLGYDAVWFHTLAEGKWVLEWDYRYENVSREFAVDVPLTLNREGQQSVETRIKKIVISPFSAWVVHEISPPLDTPVSVGTWIEINMEDGETYTVGRPGFNMVNRRQQTGRDGGEILYWFDRVIDIDQIESITFGGETEVSLK